MFFRKEKDSRLAIYKTNPKISGARVRAKFHELRKKISNELGVSGGTIGNLSTKTTDRPKWYGRLKLVMDM
jgi:hypothetical protein